MCGLECFTPGNIWTPQCQGHDLCVCKWGHAACVYSPPDDCEGCSSLLDAGWSYIVELIRSWLEQSEDDDEPINQWW
jgi:hypothetical protein